MRILLCKGQFMGPISGSDETLVTYATQLQSAGEQPTVLLMFPPAPDDQYYVRLKEAGVPVHTIASTRMHSSLNRGRKLAAGLLRTFPASRRLVRGRAQQLSTRVADRYFKECCDYFSQCRADVVHVMTPDPSAMVMIRAAHESSIPVLYHELGMPYHPPAFASYYKQFVSALPFCSEVAALSPSLIQECLEQLPYRRPISVLPVIAEDLFDARDSEAKLTDRVTFGFAARVERLKGPHVLVESFAVVASRFRNSFLRVAGVGTQLQRAVRQAEAAGIARRCDFPGAYTKVEEKRAFMQSLDVFVLPSLTEGTPNGIVEAMACGLPVIASAVGGVTDMITRETGLLVPPGEPAALANAMALLAGDRALRERMGRAGRLRYEEVFSPQSVLPLMLNTYRRVAASRHPRSAGVALNFRADVHPWSSSAALLVH
ncbi:MAG: glycosyltransferase [Pyrinomonadaceae bacterium]|nr:glycosyltransferase [Pyrinomonadaceae bacterium]